MRAPNLETHMGIVVAELRRRARHGLFDGKVRGNQVPRYIRHCTYDDPVTAARLIFTRDIGHHTSGWLKNPDYERCWHLSTSALPSPLILPGIQRAELDKPTTRAWVAAFFGEDARYLWAESPKSDIGKQHGVWHWRLFCDLHWQAILPRKEVYTLEFTEAGWRSASQVLREDGWHTSVTEDGGIIESTVDPT